MGRGHLSKGCPMPRRQSHQAIASSVCSTLTPPVASAPIESGLIQRKNTRKTSDNSRVPSKVALFHQQPLQTYGASTNRASNARRITACPNCKETVYSSSSAAQPVSPAPVHKTAINSSNALRVAPILMSTSKS
uniref:Uncharacterized protein n=1 Tax=Oryza punctata TaxID=4537 RepID=A0A0E0L2R9_ORYPU